MPFWVCFLFVNCAAILPALPTHYVLAKVDGDKITLEVIGVKPVASLARNALAQAGEWFTIGDVSGTRR